MTSEYYNNKKSKDCKKEYDKILREMEREIKNYKNALRNSKNRYDNIKIIE